MDRQKFNGIIRCVTREGCTNKDAAKHNKVSERMVQRVIEATTWERWPYIQAKSQHGYRTPEYNAYLKRRGLPLTPPAKEVPKRTRKAAKSSLEPKRSWFEKLFLNKWRR